MWHVTHDMQRMTHDTWDVTCDMLWGVSILSKIQLPSSYGLGETVFWRYFHKGWISQLVTELMSDKAVSRTTPATPVLLNIIKIRFLSNKNLVKKNSSRKLPILKRELLSLLNSDWITLTLALLTWSLLGCAPTNWLSWGFQASSGRECLHLFLK